MAATTLNEGGLLAATSGFIAVSIWRIRFAADHLTREPLEYLGAAGFEVEELERSKWGIVERVLAVKPDPT